MSKVVGAIFVCIISTSFYWSIEACHTAAHGAGRDPNSNETINETEFQRIVLSNHSLPESVIQCVIDRRLGENAGRKKRSLADLDNILTAAGASDDIKEQCKLFAPLCRAAVMCIDNLDLSSSSTTPIPVTTTTTSNPGVGRVIGGSIPSKTPPPHLVGAPLFPGMPGVSHRAKIYCRFCAEPYCRFYRRCEGRMNIRKR